MRFLFAIFKQVQVFLLAFTLAAGGLMATGVASGQLERGETYVAVSGQFAAILARVLPEVAGYASGGEGTVVDARGGVPRGAATVAQMPTGPDIRAAGGAAISLQALRQRQTAVPLP